MTYQLLLADDSATMQKVVQITFDREDFKVTAVSTGEEAIRAAREMKPHVMLLDVRMPGLDGYAVCDTLKKDPSTAGIQICLLGGTVEPFDEARARELREHRLMPKMDAVEVADGERNRGSCGRREAARDAHTIKPCRLKA